MISVAVGELGCSLKEAYKMSWAEFLIRLHAFNRLREHEYKMVRIIAYQSYCSQFMFSKERPKTMRQWWPIGDETKSRVSEQARQVFKEKWEAYIKAKENA